MGGEYFHSDLYEMAAAYLFHLANNHPFLDGNKRTALAAALAFLWLNDRRLEASDDELTELVVGIAASRLGKADAAVFISAHLRPGGEKTRRRR
jgi:death-on-curing protein